MSSLSKKNKVLLFYIFLIILGFVLGWFISKKETNMENGLTGAALAIILCVILWQNYGKKYSEKN